MRDFPETHYARTADGLAIAYQVVGDGPVDIVHTPGYVSSVDAVWTFPPYASFLRGLSSIGRLISFDRRGFGCSDRPASTEALAYELGIDDIRAVMDAAGSERAMLFGFEDGALLTALFAATHPSRTAGLVMFAPWAKTRVSTDYPWAWTDDEYAEWTQRVTTEWGTESFAAYNLAWSSPGLERDPATVAAWARVLRACGSPASMTAVDQFQSDVDLRWVLPSVQVPTLVLNREDDRMSSSEEGRYIAGLVPGARFEPLAGDHHPPFTGDTDAVVEAVARFVAGITTEEAWFHRVLATVLFTDIVGSTEQASTLGDRAWAEAVEHHHAVVRAMLARYRGVEVDTAGDGFFATFDGPARAVRCAQETIRALATRGIEIRVGVHTGEVSTIDGKAGGLAVSIGARIGARAAPSEVLVSQTVKDLVAGSGLAFDDRGEVELKGVPDRWRLYAAV